MKRERLSANERKLEIQNIALEVFTIKGYNNTSMHDLVQATGLSAGGLYHHYKSTSEILYDMMIRGFKYREDIIKKKIAEIPNPLGIEVLAELMVDKALSNNIFVPIYVMFLQSMQEDETLQQLYQDIRDSNIRDFEQMLEENGGLKISKESWNLLNDLINTFILGCETLGIREHLISQRHILKKVVIDVLIENEEEV